MSETKHTPGPWKLNLNGPECLGSENDGYRKILAGAGYANEHSSGFGITGYFSEGDARLIAAAPDLFDALKALIEPYNGFSPREVEKRCDPATFPLIMDARKAIAKVENTTT